MFAVVAASALVYAIALIAVGVYVAVRGKGGDLFASHVAKLAAIVVFALLSAIPTDILTIIWLSVVRNHVDVTANLNLFLFAVAPVVAVIATAQALVLSRVYRQRPLLLGAVYVIVYASAHATWLNILFNPPADIARHAATIVIVGSLVMLLISRFVWRH